VKLISRMGWISNLYKSCSVLNDNQMFLTTHDAFIIEDIELGVKHLAKGKAKDIEGY
jgi:hypothetical protein